MIVLQIVFWFCVAAVFHSYIFYPLLLKLFSNGKKQNEICFNNSDELPVVSVLLAVHNEEQVIERKIKTTLEAAYPKNKIELLIGDDSSTDATKEIIEGLANFFPQISFQQFNSRTGKAGIINSLSEKAKGEVLLLTDANVFFTEETIFQLVKHFKNHSIALVAGNIQPHELKHDGISKQESFYQSSENIIKFREGILWGAMMGAFGGCYAVRKNFFTPTPSKFIVDDFFITMAAIEKGGYAINELNAVCFEDISNVMKEEFRRKSRIATGNFQIISRFFNLLSPAHGGIAFAFLSHKVLRWLGPFFLLASYLISFALMFHSSLYKLLFSLQTILLLIPLFDWALRKLNIHIFVLRSISHFYVMNLALLNGFFKFLNGVKNNVWQPTKRNQ